MLPAVVRRRRRVDRPEADARLTLRPRRVRRTRADHPVVLVDLDDAARYFGAQYVAIDGCTGPGTFKPERRVIAEWPIPANDREVAVVPP